MLDANHKRRKAQARSNGVGTISKNGRPLTNGNEMPNGVGLTSGPGMINGLAYTRDTPEREPERKPSGRHLHIDEPPPKGLEVRTDLINGFSIEMDRPTWEPKKGHWWSPRRRQGSKRRMKELAEAPLPGDDAD
jgi:hypothetical protein